MLFKRAGIQLDEDDKRQRALARILRDERPAVDFNNTAEDEFEDLGDE